MDIKQEIAKLRAKLAELEARVDEPLDCYFGQGFYIMHSGGITNNQGTPCLTNYTQIRNKETAEAIAPLVQIQRALINFKCEHDPVFNNKTSPYWTTASINEYQISKNDICAAMHSVAFSTRKLARSALDMLKRRNLV